MTAPAPWRDAQVRGVLAAGRYGNASDELRRIEAAEVGEFAEAAYRLAGSWVGFQGRWPAAEAHVRKAGDYLLEAAKIAARKGAFEASANVDPAGRSWGLDQDRGEDGVIHAKRVCAEASAGIRAEIAQVRRGSRSMGAVEALGRAGWHPQDVLARAVEAAQRWTAFARFPSLTSERDVFPVQGQPSAPVGFASEADLAEAVWMEWAIAHMTARTVLWRGEELARGLVRDTAAEMGRHRV